MTHLPVAAAPTGAVTVPDAVRALAGGDVVTPVWRNQLGGLTFRLGPVDTSGPTRFVKWVAAGTPELDLVAEATRLAWAGGRAAVPRVVDQGTDADGDWLVTEALQGTSAVDARWVAEPATAAVAIGRGLRVLHDALPVDECPFTWAVADRVENADARLARGGGPHEWFPEHRDLTAAEARSRLDDPPAVDSLVVCHGDACAPNTLLHDDGTFAAHVDLGSLGVADRWADLVVAAWSTEWNYGPGFDHLVYEGYGIAPDAERIAFYRLLWDLG
ncbi:aminoglycoside 3'-phosphotransferase [Cellulosimicrobium terreum]|nr:aminoglycoside 3'-phosphotransferase [Cellulosimicrobium terreum]